jgi:hypothetical protein
MEGAALQGRARVGARLGLARPQAVGYGQGVRFQAGPSRGWRKHRNDSPAHTGGPSVCP